MKTLKLAMIAAILSIAMISYAGVDPKTNLCKVVKISLSQAQANPGLTAAMFDQLDMSFLKLEHPGLYSATVTFNNTVYKIYGKHKAWLRFFRAEPIGIIGIEINHR